MRDYKIGLKKGTTGSRNTAFTKINILWTGVETFCFTNIQTFKLGTDIYYRKPYNHLLSFPPLIVSKKGDVLKSVGYCARYPPLLEFLFDNYLVRAPSL